MARTTRSVGDVASTSEVSSTAHSRLSDRGASRIASRFGRVALSSMRVRIAGACGCTIAMHSSRNEAVNTPATTWLAPSDTTSVCTSPRTIVATKLPALLAIASHIARLRPSPSSWSSSEKVSSMNAIGT